MDDATLAGRLRDFTSHPRHHARHAVSVPSAVPGREENSVAR
jgi:hypothetical protein